MISAFQRSRHDRALSVLSQVALLYVIAPVTDWYQGCHLSDIRRSSKRTSRFTFHNEVNPSQVS